MLECRISILLFLTKRTGLTMSDAPSIADSSPDNPSGTMARIPFNMPPVTGREIEYLSKVIERREFSGNGVFTAQCQSWLKQRLDVGEVILTHSCTAALEMAAILAGLEPGDEVIMPSFTFVSTANAVVLRRAIPVFVDIRPDTLNIDEHRIEAAITPRTKAIMAVHLYGNLCDMDALGAIAKRHGLHLIEDAAEALGSIWHGRRAGSIGIFGAFSFHGTKTVTTGEGGIFVTDDPALYESVLTLSNHGRSRGETRQFWPERIGFKYKMSNMQAAIGCAQMERIDELIAGKRRVFEGYRAALAGSPLSMNPEPKGTRNGFWMPTIVIDADVLFDRQSLLAAFRADNIDGRVFFWPLSSTRLFPTDREHPASYALSSRATNLPSYHDMSTDDLERVVAAVRTVL